MATAVEKELLRWRMPAIACAVIGFGAVVAGRFVAPDEWMRSYLIALLYWLSIGLGALALFMLHNLVGGAWGFMIRRMLEASVGTIPLIAILFIPILLGMDELYLWTHEDHVQHDALLRHKAPYLNTGFFVIRAAICFGIWIAMAFFLRRWSMQLDDTKERGNLKKMQKLSAVGLLVYGVTVTFSSVDWVMSITPHWFSTVYGMIFMVANALMALAFGIVGAARFVKQKWVVGEELADHFQDLGNLLFAFVMLWTYLMASQFVIIWSANIPEETPWFILRSQGTWAWLAIFLIAFHFAAPILLLLLRRVKRDLNVLSMIALYLVIIGFADFTFLVSPPMERSTGPFHWVALAAWLGIGGLWILLFTFLIARRPLLPLGDPRLPHGLTLAGGE